MTQRWSASLPNLTRLKVGAVVGRGPNLARVEDQGLLHIECEANGREDQAGPAARNADWTCR